jgi:hypothetical protein
MAALRGHSGTLAQPSFLTPDQAVPSSTVKVIAQFDPPNAHPAARKWRDEHAAILSQLPPEAILIDTGRATGGDFVRIRVADEFADRFADS